MKGGEPVIRQADGSFMKLRPCPACRRHTLVPLTRQLLHVGQPTAETERNSPEDEAERIARAHELVPCPWCGDFVPIQAESMKWNEYLWMRQRKGVPFAGILAFGGLAAYGWYALLFAARPPKPDAVPWPLIAPLATLAAAAAVWFFAKWEGRFQAACKLDMNTAAGRARRIALAGELGAVACDAKGRPVSDRDAAGPADRRD